MEESERSTEHIESLIDGLTPETRRTIIGAVATLYGHGGLDHDLARRQLEALNIDSSRIDELPPNDRPTLADIIHGFIEQIDPHAEGMGRNIATTIGETPQIGVAEAEPETEISFLEEEKETIGDIIRELEGEDSSIPHDIRLLEVELKRIGERIDKLRGKVHE